MAHKWFDLAKGTLRQAAFDAAQQVFNDGQMRPKPAMQQQQQIQPKDEGKDESAWGGNGGGSLRLIPGSNVAAGR
jgi:hypothetical protein